MRIQQERFHLDKKHLVSHLLETLSGREAWPGDGSLTALTLLFAACKLDLNVLTPTAAQFVHSNLSVDVHVPADVNITLSLSFGW